MDVFNIIMVFRVPKCIVSLKLQIDGVCSKGHESDLAILDNCIDFVNNLFFVDCCCWLHFYGCAIRHKSEYDLFF